MVDVSEDYIFCADAASTASTLILRKLKPVQMIMIFFMENLIGHDTCR